MPNPYAELARELVQENKRRLADFDANPGLARFMADFIYTAKAQADAKRIPWADALVQDLRLTTEGHLLFSVEPDVEKITKRLAIVMPPDPGKHAAEFDKALREGRVNFGR
jgi:hypothetical protein